MKPERASVFRRQNNTHASSSECCRKRTHQTSSPSSFSPLSSTSSILILLALLQVSHCTLPSRCYQSPPDPSPTHCSGPFRTSYFYNATSRRCYRWPNWNCPGNQLFDTEQQCNDTCVTATVEPPPPEPTLTPEEICSMGVNNYICDNFEVLNLWVYNSNQKKCHTLLFFGNCLDKQPNMFDTEQECISMCGRFSPIYSPPPEPSPSSSSSSPPPTPPPTPTTETISTPPTSSSVPTLSPTNVATTTTTTTRPPPPTTGHSGPNTDHSGPTKTTNGGSTKPTDTVEVDSNSELGQDDGPLTVFDMASIGVGALIVVLIGVMVIVIVSFVHRRRKVLMLMQHHQPTAAIKSMSNPCNHLHQGNGSVVHFVNDDVNYSSSPTTSSYYV